MAVKLVVIYPRPKDIEAFETVCNQDHVPSSHYDLFQNADGFCLEDPLKILPTPRFAFRPAKKAAPVIRTAFRFFHMSLLTD